MVKQRSQMQEYASSTNIREPSLACRWTESPAALLPRRCLLDLEMYGHKQCLRRRESCTDGSWTMVSFSARTAIGYRTGFLYKGSASEVITLI